MDPGYPLASAGPRGGEQQKAAANGAWTAHEDNALGQHSRTAHEDNAQGKHTWAALRTTLKSST
ncbi:hypothetical protein J27TS7_08770 [Paenibacillus dendritiformis]|nr:hypothetical protein J27TS7_08770 [Paenibacillus dendritiformis]